jgi:hypothetical protein
MGARTSDVGKRDKISGHGDEVTRLEAAGIRILHGIEMDYFSAKVSSSRPAIREGYERGQHGLCF